MLASNTKKERPAGDADYCARMRGRSPKETRWQFEDLTGERILVLFHFVCQAACVVSGCASGRQAAGCTGGAPHCTAAVCSLHMLPHSTPPTSACIH